MHSRLRVRISVDSKSWSTWPDRLDSEAEIPRVNPNVARPIQDRHRPEILKVRHPAEQVAETYKGDGRRVKPVGLHCHIGSQILDTLRRGSGRMMDITRAVGLRPGM